MVLISSMFGPAQSVMLAFPFERPMFLREFATGVYTYGYMYRYTFAIYVYIHTFYVNMYIFIYKNKYYFDRYKHFLY
jgi:hypothetical protein